jgi:hypothetical protein
VDQGAAGLRFVDGYHVQDSETGRMLSITIWESKESMQALRGETPQEGLLGIVTDLEELFDVVGEVLRRSPRSLFTGVRGRLILRSPFVGNWIRSRNTPPLPPEPDPTAPEAVGII